MKEQMIAYLQTKLTRFQRDLERYGREDRKVLRQFDDMIACKEMAEALIGEPVNLRMDGTVTVGF